jgi:ATP-dependent protease ClpP protease subunit
MSEVSSAGVLIYIAGKKRYALKHTEFMTHPSSLSITANSLEIQETLNMLLEQGKKVEEIFKSRLRMGKKKYSVLHSSTTWIDSYFAKKLKIVTDIIDKIPVELMAEEQEQIEVEGMLVDTLADRIIEKIKEETV